MTRILDPQATHVVAHGTALLLTEDARQVGRVMALWGGGVAWWRIVHADGSLLAGHEQAALARYREEGTPLRPSAGGGPGRIDMSRARWNGGS